MSTEDQNKAVVTLCKGVDVDAFIDDMVTGNNHNEYMPKRPVELYDEKPGSKRNVDFVLTADEAANLRNDPRVIDVRYGTKIENGIFLKPSVLEPLRTYAKVSTQNNTHYNWAFPACSSRTDPFSTNTLSFSHGYTLTGKGVDVVIQDSGILTNHPEWLNLEGNISRFQQVNWPEVSGLSGTYTQDANHYTDPDGHGTHVAGTVAGRLYGWAKESNIYAITIVDNPAAFGVSASFNMIRAWHNLKPVQSNGLKRPTIVNMSWEYTTNYTNINGGNWRGIPWTGSNMISAYGMVQTLFNRIGTSAPFTYYHPTRVASVDADIEDCLDDGIILVSSAGNEAHKIDVEGGIDYNNFYNKTGVGQTFYHRGATPGSTPGVVCVGSVKIAAPEGKSFFSNTGPRINTFAPGEAIQSAIPEGSNIATAQGSDNYPLNNGFKITKISGTSMAAPQASGILACLLGIRPNYTPTKAKQWIEETGAISRLTDTGGGYTDTASLQSAANRFLRQPFSSSKVFSIKKT
jgi:subtilisin family serine protease